MSAYFVSFEEVIQVNPIGKLEALNKILLVDPAPFCYIGVVENVLYSVL